MTEEQIREQVQELNRLFNITPCKVHLDPQPPYGRDAYYSNDFDMITVNQKHLARITPSIVVHEFAHHLVYYRSAAKKHLKNARLSVKRYERAIKEWDFSYQEYQKARAAYIAPKPNPRKVKRHIIHGKDFVMCLKQVIKRSGIDYDTTREYVTIARQLKGNPRKS